MATKKGRPLKKRGDTGEFFSKTGMVVKESWCRRCRRMKPPKDFFDAVDTFVDTNGLMSVCRPCLEEMYGVIFSTEATFESTILRLCRIMNVKYDETAVKSAIKHYETANSTAKKPMQLSFGLYLAKLRSIGSRFGEDFRYVDLNIVLPNKDPGEMNEETISFWGEGFSESEYLWLEKEKWKWMETHKIDTRSEEHLLRLIVLKLFDIRKARIENRETSSLEKNFQDLLKTSALSPAMTNAANSGKNLDTFGKWIEEIEKYEPAEWMAEEGADIFYDVSNVKKYFEEYILRPTKNFILQSKDFNVENEDNDEGIDVYDDSEEVFEEE